MKAVIPPAGECIYCGCKDGLSKEHIIPLSLGGTAGIPDASCGTCRNITSKIEFAIARKSFHVARAVHKLPSRRPQEFSTTDKISISYGKYGPTKEVEVPLDEAPQSVIFPFYQIMIRDTEGVLSSIKPTVESTIDRADKDAKIQKILKRHRAYSISMRSNTITIGDFEPFLWKIAHCLLWMFDSNLARKSVASRYVRGLEDSLVKSGEGPLLARNIYSTFDIPPHDSLVAAALLTKESEEHRYFHFEIEFLRGAGLPAYYCMVANPSKTPVMRTKLL